MKVDRLEKRSGAQQTTNQSESVDTRVRDVVRDIIGELEQLEEEKNELAERVGEIEATADTATEEIGALTERVDELEAENTELREQVATLHDLEEQVASLEGDVECPACGGQIRAGQVSEVMQEETGSGLLNTAHDGLVTQLRCPDCGEMVEMTHLSEEEREQLTNELRRAGVASGEPTELDEQSGGGTESGE